MGRGNRDRPKRLGEKLKAIRSYLGLNKTEMVERLKYPGAKLHPQNVLGFEKSEREPNLLILLAYSRLVKIHLEVLVDDEMDLPERLQSKPKHK
jgi:hypothetical protein